MQKIVYIYSRLVSRINNQAEYCTLYMVYTFKYDAIQMTHSLKHITGKENYKIKLPVLKMYILKK